MSITNLQAKRFSFLKLCGTVTFTLMGAIQCSWTPTIETLIHQSEKGRVVLQTSSALSTPPKHPQYLSESLIKQIFQGVSQSQERGILQELFLSSSTTRPIFSQAQIDFLTPHIVAAFTQATPEELIAFKISGDKDGATRLTGKVAIFSPTVLFLTLQSTGNSQGKRSKIALSSRNLQKQITLLYSEEQAILPQKEAKRLMQITSKDSWLAINYAIPRQSGENIRVEDTPPLTPIPGNQSQENQPDTNTIQRQLQDLRNTVDEQTKEIQELQQASPE